MTLKPHWPDLPLLTNVTSALLLALMVYLAYLAFWPFPTVDFRRQPYRVVSTEVRPGDPLLYEVDICKRTDAPATVVRQLAGNGTFVSLPTVATNVAPGCSRSISATTIIPEGLPPGTYHLEMTLCYRVNPLRTICKNARTADFAVLPAAKP